METKENRIKRLALFCESKDFMDTSTIDEFYQLEIKRETNDIKGRYQLALFLLSTFFVGLILAVVFSQKDYCTPDNSKESKIVQNMQLQEKTTELEMQYRERFDSLQNYIDLRFPVKIINKVSEIPKSWERGLLTILREYSDCGHNNIS